MTDVRFENTSATTQTNVPVTFGQVFAVGHLKAGEQLSGRLDDGTTVPLQVDVKAKHADGSIRHAVISAVLPSLAASTTRTMSLVKGGTAPTGSTSIDMLMRNGFSASVHAKLNGVDYYASADDLLKRSSATTWLSGPIATEWQVHAPLQTASGVQHPHLQARFAIRWFPGVNKARVDVVVENDWAYEPSPQNFTYDANVIVGGKSVYTKTGMVHFNHARWRKVFWFNGTEPQVDVKFNTAYLLDSKALPNYDRSLKIAESALTTLQKRWTGSNIEPMVGAGLAENYMPATGGRDDIGLLPGWGVSYLLSMDKRARMVTMGTADLAGTWSAHYRDKLTDKPVSLLDYPYMTIYGQASDTMNPTTGKREAFPACATTDGCKTTLTHDSAHQPAFAYLPYMLTGDYYYLEELQFWAMWNQFSSNPGYRQNVKGLLQQEQVRAQAWSLRTLAEAAYITPDSDRLKSHFTQILNSNLDWYNATYTNNTSANKLGIIVNGYALGYNNGSGMAPWMDDFFTSAVGHTADLGFDKATALLKWKAQFSVARMTAPGTCWIDGAPYALNVRTNSTSPFFTTYAEAYKATHTSDFVALACGSSAMAASLKLKVGEMTGYAAATAGYPANMQPALAYTANVMGTAGKTAWAVFMNRSVKPDYSTAAQFDIVPR
ncbi:hypothetical protein AB595_27415 [Massilia sp. WF1]|nr:hypothetical protein AM586_01630 [Massilia sp. WG5]KNZ67603.1 hypothetical protein AB595_27415 [Massilia sp. WF1]